MKKNLGILFVWWVLPMASLFAQTFTVLDNFTNSGTPVYGATPYGPLAVGGGRVYGTTEFGGANVSSGYGTVFSAGTTGAIGLTVLHTFTNSPDGAYPYGGLLLTNGILYGTASGGGIGGGGTVFSMDTNGGNFTVLHSFIKGATNDGAVPLGRLIFANGVLYGTTQNGGTNNPQVDGTGTVFALTIANTNFTILHSFANGYDGSYPQADLVLYSNRLYGTTDNGGTNQATLFCQGTVFGINTNGGPLTVLHTFTNTPDGATPMCGLALGGATLYGTTLYGGTNLNGYGAIFSVGVDGSNYAVLHSFNNSPDGQLIYAGLVLAGGTLYGAASAGGATPLRFGTLFSLGTDGGNFNEIHEFDSQYNGVDGYAPSDLTYAGGTLYGTASGGMIPGIVSDGLVFSLAFPVTPIPLTIQLGVRNVTRVSWNDPSQVFNLQTAPTVNGMYTNIPNAASPYIFSATNSQQYFRLQAN